MSSRQPKCPIEVAEETSSIERWPDVFVNTLGKPNLPKQATCRAVPKGGADERDPFLSYLINLLGIGQQSPSPWLDPA